MDQARKNELLGTLARGHHGLLARHAATEAGVSHSALTRRVRSGLLEQVAPAVYRWSGSPVTWDQRALLACWTAGPDALLSHRAAALRWGLDGVGAAPFEVLTDRWTRRGTGSALVHEAHDIITADRSVVGPTPITSPLRTVLDLAAVIAS